MKIKRAKPKYETYIFPQGFIMQGPYEERCIDIQLESIDAIIVDPPYGLEFMGKDFDTFSLKWKEFENLPEEWINEVRS